jgi:dTDP-glucose 4,6-dehydratase
VPRFVQVSTDEVYGDVPPGRSSSEEDPLRPSSPYAASKAGGDLQVLAYVRTYGVDACITRGANTYGPNQFPEKLVPLFVTNALDGEPLPVYGDGRQVRNWLYVEDFCRGILAVLERGRAGEAYNVGGPDECENIEVVRRILELTGQDDSLIEHVTDRPGHDRRHHHARLPARPLGRLPIQDRRRSTARRGAASTDRRPSDPTRVGAYTDIGRATVDRPMTALPRRPTEFLLSPFDL